MPLGGLHTVSFYNPADGTVVQLNSIQEKEGELIIGRPFDENKNTRGEAIYGGGENMIELLVDGNSALFTQILAWERAGTRVRAVGAGFARNLQWYEDTLIQILPKNHLAPGNLNGRVIRLHRPGPELNIFANRNLLAFLGWQDANANNMADGYATDGASPSFSANVQAVTLSNINESIWANIVFPITGVKFTKSSDHTVLTALAKYIDIRFMTFGAASLILQNLSSTPVTSVGIKSVLSSASPAATYVIRVGLILMTSSGAASAHSVRNPALTTDGSLTPGTTFMDF